jgi:hypothetical protein
MIAPVEYVARAQDRRTLGNGIALSYEARLYRVGGNEHPHFSLTGVETDRGREVAWGQLHERLLEVWPDLAPLAAIHLADDRGVPMHAAANMAYWLGFAPVYESSRSYGPTPPDLDVASRHWRITVAEAKALLDRCDDTVGDLGQPDRYALAAAFLGEVAETTMAATWQQEADEALSLIRRLAA